MNKCYSVYTVYVCTEIIKATHVHKPELNSSHSSIDHLGPKIGG